MMASRDVETTTDKPSPHAVPSHARQQAAWRPIAASRNSIQLGASMRAIGASLVDSDTRDMFGSARPTP
ncbi:MAG TPA: hypothetical protein P5081_22295 [Phycisphaerae bacterium]|nr:hypothetical protein [Phycisphaerae bacterium]